MGIISVNECSSIDQIVNGIILEVKDDHIHVICRYKIDKRIFLKKEFLNVAVKSQIVMSKFTTKHCLML